MYGRDEREDIGNQGEENVKALLSYHFGKDAIQDTSGQDGHPDIYIITDLGRIVIEVKSMMPFSHNKTRKGKIMRKVGYAHFNRTSWAYLNSFARSKIAAVSSVVEVRFNNHPNIYFVLKREDVEAFNITVGEKAEWMDIPLWYIFERGIGFNLITPPEFDWTPVETNQAQIGSEDDG
jgi:hypothetical protein